MKYFKFGLGISILLLIGSIALKQNGIQNNEEQTVNPDTYATLQLKVTGMT